MNLKKRYHIQLPSLMTLLFMLVLSVVIGYLGPFGSYELSLPIRLTYWTASIFMGYFIYYHSFMFTEWLFAERKVNRFIKFIIPSVVSAFILTFCIGLLTYSIFDTPDGFAINFFDFFPQVFLVGLIISYISSHFHKTIETKKTSQPTTKTQAGKIFLDRLPHALGDELICFVMEDHYLKVATTKGEQMLLMRMKDALVELADYDDLQVHRSWWVARDAVARTKKNGRNLILVLENDTEVPVSRTFLKKVKEAGLF